MGDRLARGRARQHPDLISLATADHRRVEPALRVAVLTLLGVDGVISAVLGAVFLQIHVDAVPVPLSALISGLVNALLVWVGLQWTPSVRLAAIALWTWLLAVAAMTLAGPGGDAMFGGPGLYQFSPFVLLVLGVVPPGIVLWRRQR